MQSRVKQRERLIQAFSDDLEAHMDAVDKLYIKNGFGKVTQLREKRKETPPAMRFEWLYYRHFRAEPYSAIVKRYNIEGGLSEAQVQARTQELAELIGITA